MVFIQGILTAGCVANNTLDNCCLQRPLDDQTQPRIKVETEAVFSVLSMVQAGEQLLLGSEALEYEISRIPDITRREDVLSVLALASERLLLTDEVESLALDFEQGGLGALDAIHLEKGTQPFSLLFLLGYWHKA